MSTNTRPGQSTKADANSRSPASEIAQDSWTIDDSAMLYDIASWGGGNIRISERGTVEVIPSLEASGADGAPPAIDLAELVRELIKRNIWPPVVVRFSDLLRGKMRSIRAAFDRAIRELNYNNSYTGLYPIKVNQQRGLCEEVLAEGRRIGFGLEAGSKPELWAVLGMTAGMPEVPIVCNGFKDSEYLETVVLAAKLGRDITPIIEHPSELEAVLRFADTHSADIKLGVRYRPAAPGGSGRWADSAGERSKFGLSPGQLVEAVQLLKERGMLDRLRLLHFHVGSQIGDIQRFSSALSELAATYVQLRMMGAGLDAIDVGGGLGVNYLRPMAGFENGLNYTLDEYAEEVVGRIRAACNAANQPHPRILSESGRAMVAESSMLIVDVHGSSRRPDNADAQTERARLSGEKITTPMEELLETLEYATEYSPSVAIQKAQRAHADLLALYRLGGLGLEARAAADRLYWTICRRAIDHAREAEAMTEELEGVEQDLADLLVANMSLFQSLPDSWAIGQVFPILPLTRLNEKPTRRVRLVDLTCDSDGRIDYYQSWDGVSSSLPLHEPKPGEETLIGIFHVGAYQEVLGDWHNLFGDTHVVHVSIDDDGELEIHESIPGDTVRRVLSFVQHNGAHLQERIRLDVERAQKEKRLSLEQGQALLRHYAAGLDGYTYMED